MTEYRIVELNRMFSIEVKKGKEWGDLNLYGVPRFFASLADARSWVATIKRGVVYHDAEEVPIWPYPTIAPVLKDGDAPNLAQDERKAEVDTSNGIKPLEWFEERVYDIIVELRTSRMYVAIDDHSIAKAYHRFQTERGYRYEEQR